MHTATIYATCPPRKVNVLVRVSRGSKPIITKADAIKSKESKRGRHHDWRCEVHVFVRVSRGSQPILTK